MHRQATEAFDRAIAPVVAWTVGAALALLATVAWVAVAHSGTLVVDFSGASDYASSLQQALNARDVMVRELREADPTPGAVRVVDYRAAKLLWVRNAQDVTGWNGSTGTGLWQGDYVVMVPWKPGIDAKFDSLTLRAGWPNKPVTFVGPTSYGVNKWTNSSACSTGITSSNAGVAVPALSYAFYSMKGDQVWRSGAAQLIVAGIAGRPARGIWRGIIGYGLARNVVTAGGYQLCSDCDYVVRSTASAAESVMVWEYLRSSLETAPLTFVDLGASYRTELALIGISRGDSASAGKIVKKPFQAGVEIGGYFETNGASASINGVAPGQGPHVPASGAVDTLNQFGSSDSVRYSGIKAVAAVQVNADTLVALAYQGRILSRMGPKVRLTPSDYAGTRTALNYSSGWFGGIGRGLAAGGNTSLARIQDVWGVDRTRTWVKPGIGGTCAAPDSASPCLIETSFARAESLSKALGLGGVDHVVWAPSMDWTPKEITRENATKLDSVLNVALAAKVKGFLTSPYIMDASPSAYRSPATQPVGWGNSEGSLMVRDLASGVEKGRIALLTTRGWEPTPNLELNAVHDILGEFLLGWLAPPWFWSADGSTGGIPATNFYHDLQRPLSILAVTAASLGGTGDGTQPRRMGWWAIKGLAHIQSCANSYGWPGHKIAEIVYPEELATGVIQ